MRKHTGQDNHRGDKDPDTALVLRIANGEQAAASELVSRHLSKMVSLARHMLGDAVEAEDVAQEVFMKVWQSAHKWQPGKAKFETWMHRVAINACYDRLRRRREVYTDQIPDRADKDTPGADQMIIEAELSQQVEDAIMHLPARQRAALSLCHLREMSNKEAARALEISVEALESLLARGRRGLRKHLAGHAAAMLER